MLNSKMMSINIPVDFLFPGAFWVAVDVLVVIIVVDVGYTETGFFSFSFISGLDARMCCPSDPIRSKFSFAARIKSFNCWLCNSIKDSNSVRWRDANCSIFCIASSKQLIIIFDFCYQVRAHIILWKKLTIRINIIDITYPWNYLVVIYRSDFHLRFLFFFPLSIDVSIGCRFTGITAELPEAVIRTKCNCTSSCYSWNLT